jgi:glycosyltransferase involved in cell wall biosynthesis
MGTGNLIFEIFIMVFCIGWWISCLIMVRIAGRLRIFEKEAPAELRTLPKLSIIIPACNEAETIKEAVNTILEQDYPDLEILLIDDRSTDETGAIIDNFAEKDSRVKGVHIEKLPQGWLGKVNALNTGATMASGEWMLFTDADIHFSRGTLRKAVSLAVSDRADHFAILPLPIVGSFWFDVVIHTFGAMFLYGTGAVDAGSSGSKAFVGTGAFNLVRSSAFKNSEGFSWLKMEPVDDVGLGLMLRISGAKSSFAVTTSDISLVWYPSIRAMFKGVEKNFFGAVANYSLTRMVIVVAFIWAFALAPLAALISFNTPPLFMLGIVTYLFMALGAFFVGEKLGQKFFPLFMAQFGLLIVSIMFLRSGIICKLKGGIDWRGTRYKTEDLLAGQRLKMGVLRIKRPD